MSRLPYDQREQFIREKVARAMAPRPSGPRPRRKERPPNGIFEHLAALILRAERRGFRAGRDASGTCCRKAEGDCCHERVLVERR